MNDYLIELDGKLIAEIYKYRHAMNPDQFTKDLAAAKESKRQFDEMRRAIEAAPESSNGTAGRNDLPCAKENTCATVRNKLSKGQ